MKSNKKIYKELRKKHTDAEIAEAIIFPSSKKMTKKEAEAFRKFREEQLKNKT